jgi:hypothetical protein
MVKNTGEIMKKVKQATRADIEKMFPRKVDKSDEIKKENDFPNKDLEEHDCSTCDDKKCKAKMIMENLMDTIEFAEQIDHHELFNILLTIHCVLQNLHFFLSIFPLYLYSSKTQI